MEDFSDSETLKCLEKNKQCVYLQTSLYLTLFRSEINKYQNPKP